MIRILKTVLIILSCITISILAYAKIEVVSDFGIQFEVPADFVTEIENPGAYKSWINSDSTISLVIVKIPKTHVEMEAFIKELKNPGASRSFINSYGNAQIKALKSSSIDCIYDGQVIDTSGAGSVILFEISFVCEQMSEYNSKQRLIMILTKSGQLMIQIDSREVSNSLSAKLFDEVSKSISINASNQISVESKIDSNAIVSGGKGIRIVDYGQINNDSIVATYFGGLVSAILFGYLITLLFLKVNLSIMTATLLSQSLIILLRVFGAEEGGVWNVDPILYLVTGFIATIVISKLLKRRKEK